MIKVDNDYYIQADTYCYIVMKYQGKSKKSIRYGRRKNN